MNELNKKPIRDRNLGELWDNTKEFFGDLIDLRDGMDQEGTLANIQNNKRMEGANAWLLMCSIMVASLGLDLNSPAVIIGAMLISPLMSPILGIGLGVGINDRKTLKISLQHFGIAIAIALVTSVIYFKLTPFGNITDEIMSRTSPTLLDGLVAIFGGLAGVISITRLDKSNAIPGVAIATALMPPLCVAGYGLAKGEWSFFLNAFYLFFLNSFFIALTTYLIIRILGFPYKKYPNDKERRRNKMYIIVFSMLILIPASKILYSTVVKTRATQKIENFLETKIKDDETILSEWHYVDEKKTSGADTIKLILEIVGKPLSDEKIEFCDLELEKLLNKPVMIVTYQSAELPIENILKLENQMSGFEGEVKKQLQALQLIQDQKTSQIEALKSQIDSTNSLQQIYKEIKINHEALEEIAISKNVLKSDFEAETEIPMVLVKWNKKLSATQKRKSHQEIIKFLQTRMGLDTIQLVAY